MRLHARSFAWLLPFFLTGCIHVFHRHPVQPVAPPIDTASKSAPPAVEHPPLDATIPSVPIASGAPVPPALKLKPRIRRKKPGSGNGEQAASAQQAPGNAQQVPANAPPAASEAPAVSAVGQLSSGEHSDLRQQIEESITSIDRGLNGIGRQLSEPEQKTAAQIREYLKQARDALASGDLDGARTLAAKAKVLLGELSG
ncbi:MAG: hypothetical protein ABR912_04340 [Terracidiphilus sp.]|jgi:hypothetical protein